MCFALLTQIFERLGDAFLILSLAEDELAEFHLLCAFVVELAEALHLLERDAGCLLINLDLTQYGSLIGGCLLRRGGDVEVLEALLDVAIHLQAGLNASQDADELSSDAEEFLQLV